MVEPHSLNPVVPREPPLFLCPACRRHCNSSPGVLLEHQSQLHALPHEGRMTDGACVCVSPILPVSIPIMDND